MFLEVLSLGQKSPIHTFSSTILMTFVWANNLGANTLGHTKRGGTARNMNRGIIESEPVIFVGYPSNQQDFLVLCPGRGPTKLVASNNLVFGT